MANIYHLGYPKVRYEDNNGEALSGGLVYFYTNGTSTKKDTYPTLADALAGTNANTNPVVLDSRGEATIVLKGPYKIVLAPAGDTDPPTNAIWTSDNINTINDIYDSNANKLLTLTGNSSAVNWSDIQNSATGNDIIWSVLGSDTNVNLQLKTKNAGIVKFNSNGGTAATVTGTSSGVNYIDLANVVTGSGPIVAAKGTDTNIDVNLSSKGTGVVNLNSKDTKALQAIGVASAVNYLTTTNSIASSDVLLAPAGGDTNIALAISGKGSGKVKLSGISYPTADGTASYLMKTNGSGVLSFTETATPTMFQAYRSTNQTISNNTITKVQFDTEVVDTGGYYDNTTNYRFTPLKAGYYSVNAQIQLLAGTGTFTYKVYIYKNGSEIARNALACNSSSGAEISVNCRKTVQMNGSTDYLEAFCYQNIGSSSSVVGASTHSYFEAFKVSE